MGLVSIAVWLVLALVGYMVYRYLQVRALVNVPWVSVLLPGLYNLPRALLARHDFYQAMTDASLALGEGEKAASFAFFVPFLGTQPWIFLGSSDDSKAILSDQFENFGKGALAEHLRIFLGR